MAWIFKKSEEKNSPYFFEYTDHLGVRRRKKGFPNKRDTEIMAAKYELDAGLRREGLIDPVEEKFVEVRKRALKDHLTDYETSLKANQRSPKHVRLTMRRIRRVFEGCGYRLVSDFDAPQVETWLDGLCRDDDSGPRTFNHYLQAITAFCNWMKRSGRMRANPFDDMTRRNTNLDIRRTRRALNPDEISRLVDAALVSCVCVQSYEGPMRASAYMLAYYTGFRQKELASLTPQSFRFAGDCPVVLLDAKFTKNGKPAEIPLHPDLLHMLEGQLPAVAIDAPIFPKFAGKKAWLMVKKDLERIGIPYENEEGVADFHSLRASYIKYLLHGGATIVEAQHLARHFDIRTTARYAKVSREDKAKAVRNLPSASISGQWNSQYPAQPECPRESINVPGDETHPRALKACGDETSVTGRDQESGVGDNCRQPRKEWRRRGSNPRPATFPCRLLRA